MLTVMSPFRDNLAEAAQDLAIAVQGNQTEATHYPAKDRTSEMGLNAEPVGWFSNRIPICAQSGIRVTRFHVWQDLSTRAGSNVAPLHATITFEMSNEWYSSLSRPNGVIRIGNVRRKEIIEAELMIHQATSSIESAQPLLKRQVQFVMSPTSLLYSKLDVNKPVRGIVRMKFWNRRVTIKLPETKIAVIR